MSLRVYVVDDEPLAVSRLLRLLERSGRVEIVGSATNPLAALDFLSRNPVDALFLDIEMPGLNGFELLARLPEHPVVIVTTAYDQYALQAFEVNSIDYLLKPVEPAQLDRALSKAERLRGSDSAMADLRTMVQNIAALLQQRSPGYPDRIAMRVGERVGFLELARVTHFYAEDKLTYAAADGKQHCVDSSLAELEQRLDPGRFIRIHRATLLNAAWVKDIAPGFAGSYLVRLKDAGGTELTISRNRAREVKSRLGI